MDSSPPPYSEIMSGVPVLQPQLLHSNVADHSSAVPAHTFQPIIPMSTASFAPAGGVAGVGEMTSAYDAAYQQQPPVNPGHQYPKQPMPSSASAFVTHQPIGGGGPMGYGTMDSGAVPIVAVPPATTMNITHHTIIVDDLRLVNGCPVCRIGVLEDNFPCCALCCAIAFFPAGILCCLCMRNKRCSHCHVEF